MELIDKLKEFIENKMRSCSMDIGGITPLYVYRMWGGSVAIEEIANAMALLGSPTAKIHIKFEQ